MEKIIGGDEHGDSEIEHQNLCIFSRLVALQLSDIPNLKSIHRWVLPFFFPRITVLGCPNLRKLPLNSNSATKTLKIIKEDSSWWEGLEWENDNLNCIFNRYFVSGAFGFESETQSDVIKKKGDFVQLCMLWRFVGIVGFHCFLSSLFSDKPIGFPLPGTFFVFASIYFML